LGGGFWLEPPQSGDVSAHTSTVGRLALARDLASDL
jgi:hypothetical protein